jgi:adenylate cyclase
MAEERVERRLAAILVADVVGYSALIRADEEGTRAAVRQHITVTVEPQVATHKGRIFNTVGDGLLAEFASVVDAVRCAVEIQNAIKNHNADVVAEKRVEFRIGVNLGDVIAEGDDLHGDGVNVAARLEGLADPQGICISGSAFEQVRDKLEVGFEDLGDQQVKNIDRPVRAYRVLTDPDDAGKIVTAPTKQTTPWKLPAIAAALVIIIAASGLSWWQPLAERIEPASPERMAFPLPDRPSIAVLGIV